MTWFSRLRGRLCPRPPERAPEAAARGNGPEEAQLEMSRALTCALDACGAEFRLARHAAEVARCVRALAEACGVGADDVDALVCAARLHELGRLGVPRLGPEAAADREMDHRRAHARFGGEIARRARGERVGWLVEHQYARYSDLRGQLPEGDRRVLLAGLLRVADVAELHLSAGGRGRPAAGLEKLLRDGRGSLYHPAAVDAFLSTTNTAGPATRALSAARAGEGAGGPARVTTSLIPQRKP